MKLNKGQIEVYKKGVMNFEQNLETDKGKCKRVLFWMESSRNWTYFINYTINWNFRICLSFIRRKRIWKIRYWNSRTH